MTTRRRLRRPIARTLVLLSLGAAVASAAACGRERETGYEGPFKREVDRAIPMLEASTGLPFKTPPKLELRTREQVREFLETQFNEQLSPLELAGVESAYKRLGLLPDTLDLRGFLLELLTEQVAGYYDPKTKVLYVVEGGSPDITSITISHELVHALQDQYFPLDSAQRLKGDNDRQVALQSVIEGQAMYEQMASMLGGSDFGLRLPGGWDQVRETIRNEQASMPLFANAPVLIQETLLFPYLAGAEFNRQFKRARPGVAPFAPLAASTEQILHPEKLLDSVPDWPTRVELAAPRGFSLVHEDNLGAFETRLFLFQHLGDVGTAAQGAKGWDGDRYQRVRGAGGSGIAWLTVWDSPIEAAEYRDQMERMVERRFGVTRGSGGAGATRRWTARDRRLTLTSAEIGGRPVVVWEDLPQRAAGSVIDLSRVTLREQ
jgi:hypothetical protein